jgi:glyoxylase-like metal-dependent hydrolase (beta-lactamase superfamily II)
MAEQRTLTSVLGNSQRLDGGAMFGNAPRALWTRWCEPDELNRIPLACRALLVRDAGRTILFETGIGAFFAPKMKERFGVVEDEHVLLASLANVGVQPDDIDIVVLSHLHFDHAGGLLKAYEEGQAPALAFPRARVVVGEEAWARARNPHFRDRASFIPELITLLEEPTPDGQSRLELVAGEQSELLGEGFRFHRSSGHTPGMMLAEIAMPDGPVVFAADLIPGTPWVHLPITMGYDRFPEQLIDEKSALLESLVDRSGRLFYTHDSSCAVSGVERDERGRFRATDTLPDMSDVSR